MSGPTKYTSYATRCTAASSTATTGVWYWDEGRQHVAIGPRELELLREVHAPENARLTRPIGRDPWADADRLRVDHRWLPPLDEHRATHRTAQALRGLSAWSWYRLNRC